ELVELDQRLGQVEIDRAAAHPFAVQHKRQLLHQLETPRQRTIALAQSRISLQQQVNVRVGHALRAADHASLELLAHDLAAMIDLEQRREPSRSACGTSEQMSVESSYGSMGTARSGK